MPAPRFCRCGDIATMAVMASTVEATTNKVVAFACNPCAARIVEERQNSAYYNSWSDYAWSEVLKPEHQLDEED